MTFLDKLVENGVHQHVDQATRHRGNDTPQLLDLVITHEETNIDEVVYTHISPLGKSDHYSTLLPLLKYRCYTNIKQTEKEDPLPHKVQSRFCENEDRVGHSTRCGVERSCIHWKKWNRKKICVKLEEKKIAICFGYC